MHSVKGKEVTFKLVSVELGVTSFLTNRDSNYNFEWTK